MRLAFVLMCVLLAGRAAAEPEWNRVHRDELFEVQLDLARGANEQALAKTASHDVADPPVAQWMAIYAGVALDRLGRREEALASYRRAAAIHPHPMALRGQEKPLLGLKHLDELARVVASVPPFRAQRTRDEASGITTALLVPEAAAPAAGHPLVVRVGHPGERGNLFRQLLAVRAAMPANEPALLATSDLLQAGKGVLVDDAALLKSVPPRFERWVDTLAAQGVDPDRIYLTGYSYDGVWAWMLGYARPQRYAAVVALSAVSYPDPIQAGLRARVSLPVCVLRAELDHMYPQRLKQEQETGVRLLGNNPQSRFEIVPGARHDALWPHAPSCFAWMLRQRRATAVMPSPEPAR